MHVTLSLLGAAGLLWGIASPSALPDRRTTPGAVDPAVTQANIESTICVPGYSRRVRPPYRVMDRLKAQAMHSDHTGKRFGEYEFDHLVSLSIGGAPDDRHNLWLDSRSGQWNAEAKDRLEYALWVDVCHRGLPLATAQRAMATNWIAVYKRWVEGQPHATWHTRDD